MNESCWGKSFILVGVVVLGLTACREKTVGGGRPDLNSAGRSVVFDSMSKSVDSAALELLRWQDVGPTTEACVRYRLVEETLRVAAPLTTQPVVYLRGLLKFSLADSAGAAGEWAGIEVNSIPPDHLYAPWRLSATAPATDGGNRYEAALTTAVAANRVSPLIRARFQGIRGQWREALDGYLLTDPAAWTPFDVRIFSGMKLQAACRRDVEVLMVGALKGGRVAESLQVDMARLIKTTPQPDKQALAERLRTDPVLAKAAIDGAARALGIRQSFASDRFAEVLEQVARIEPLQATDEIVMLALLAAARMKDPAGVDRWADEYLRRNPDTKTRQWIASIREQAH